MVALFAVLPFVAYPVFLMQVLCFALFACAFNLLIGYVGLVSFGHALYFGFAGYLSAYVAKYGTISFPFWFGKLIWLSIPCRPNRRLWRCWLARRPPRCSASLPAASPSAARASISP